MSNPAYLWLTDEKNSPIVGICLVSGRVGAIELKSFTHNVSIPADNQTGRLTGTRVHSLYCFKRNLIESHRSFIRLSARELR